MCQELAKQFRRVVTSEDDMMELMRMKQGWERVRKT